MSPHTRNTTQSKRKRFLIEIFSLVTDIEEMLELIVEESNLYAHQNGGNFTVNKEKLTTFLGIKLRAINLWQSM